MGFCKDFVWGTATAAFQVEGAAQEDGRGLSVWDVYTKEPGKIIDGYNADVSCDHYHRLEEDVRLMAELGLKGYRFSISWTRILPAGTGEINEKGIDFYNKLIDLLLAHNITPYMTLFHWDYPYELEKKGAWLNPDSPKWFSDYAAIVAKAFGDRVKNFITYNEPQCFIGSGYTHGEHAPGKKLPMRDIIPMIHNALIGHGLAVQEIRRHAPDAKVGYAPTFTHSIPLTDSPEDIEAARRTTFDVDPHGFTWNAAWFSDPVMLGQYPEDSQAFPVMKQYLPGSWREDLKIICQPLDYYGQNIYNGPVVKAGKNGPEYVSRKAGSPKTAFNWPITPEVLYWGPKFLFERYKKPIIIMENGMSCHDAVSLDGQVHDPNRIDFTHRYLRELRRAADDGIDIAGYMHWSFMDNFEWAHGYKERFGLVFVDFETLERTPKDSYYWYKDVIATNGDNL